MKKLIFNLVLSGLFVGMSATTFAYHDTYYINSSNDGVISGPTIADYSQHDDWYYGNYCQGLNNHYYNHNTNVICDNVEETFYANSTDSHYGAYYYNNYNDYSNSNEYNYDNYQSYNSYDTYDQYNVSSYYQSNHTYYPTVTPSYTTPTYIQTPVVYSSSQTISPYNHSYYDSVSNYSYNYNSATHAPYMYSLPSYDSATNYVYIPNGYCNYFSSLNSCYSTSYTTTVYPTYVYKEPAYTCKDGITYTSPFECNWVR